MRKLGITLLKEHEKLFCSYWWKTFGPSISLLHLKREDRKKILRNLGLTLLHEHEKLFCSYWCQTFGPPISLLQLLDKGISVRATQLPTEGI